MATQKTVDSLIISVEEILSTNTLNEEHLVRARRLFREYLLGSWPTLSRTSTIADAVAEIAADTRPFHADAAYLLRYLGVPGFLPDSNSTNNLYRNLVEVVERALPALGNFFKVNEKKQTYEKIEIYISAHSNICALLNPIRLVPAEFAAVLNSKQAVLSVLNHSAVRAYCAPFGLAAGKGYVETLFLRFARLNVDSDSLSIDVREAEDAARAGVDFCNANLTFLTGTFLLQFFNRACEALNHFVAAARSRLTSDIVHRLPANETLQKRYALHSEGREIALSIPLRNLGPATAVRVTARIECDSDDIVFDKDEIILGNVSPGNFSLVAGAMILNPVSELAIMVTISWQEAGGLELKTKIFNCNVKSQIGDVDWSKLENRRPYTAEVAIGPTFVGRGELLQSLANKMLQTPMEPFYVTGQKRVGKTSLVLAAAEFAKTHRQSGSFHVCYSIWGEFAYSDPADAIRALGNTIAPMFSSSLPVGREFPGKLEFEGSLAPLIRLARHANDMVPGNKYVIILDEFDEIHQELYLQGNLAETFFANLRALSTVSNVCLVLVGGENMPFVMDRQGQKLNRFVRVGLDYFSRDRDWLDFVQLVSRPTAGTIHWHEEAVSEVFNVTNGNPYFANLLCAEVFSAAVSQRDADLTADEVSHAVARQVARFGTNSFIHLWQDGIYKASSERESDVLRRKRLLVAIARLLRTGGALVLENIAESCRFTLLSAPEVLPVVNDFLRRRILTEEHGVYDFVLPIFRLWIAEVGISQLASDTIGEELARSVEAMEEQAYVTATEREELIRKWPPYQGRYISGDAVEAWLEQVDTNRKRRLLFTLLQHIHFFDEQKIRNTLRTAHGMLRPALPQFVQRKRSHRRLDLIVTYVDGEGKSGQYYASKYAEENNIGTRSILSSTNFAEKLQEYQDKHNNAVAAVVIVDDIVATGRSWCENIRKFVQANESILRELRVPVTAVALTATVEGEEFVRKELSKIDWIDIDLRVCELLSPSSFAFNDDNGIWKNMEDREAAKALCVDLGAKIYPNDPLGFGGQGLLVVFPDTCPNNSLPIIHSFGARGDWTPLLPRLTN